MTTARKMADVEITTSIDFGDQGTRLSDEVRKVFERWEKKILETRIKDKWEGWDYIGRPKNAPVNVSLKGWKSTLETNRNQAALTIVNQARDYRTGTRAYVAYVHRAGETTPEVDKIWDDIQSTDVPAMRADLTAAIGKALAAPKRRRKINPGRGKTVLTKELEG